VIDNSRQNRVCSVVFIDIVGYSRRTVAEQIELRRDCNTILADALGPVQGIDRVIVDTGDGAAVTFLGAPENALFAGLRVRDGATRLPLRIGINLGPVRLVSDLNSQQNVVGDGINVAQRVMSFCEPGELLVSRSFYEVACRLATDYVDLFELRGTHLDKNSRAHEVYTLVPDARARLRHAEAEWLQRTPLIRKPSARAAAAAVAPPAGHPDEPARVFDAGTNLIVSGYSRASVEQALAQLGPVQLISPASQVGEKWVATCEHPGVPVSACTVVELGYSRMVTGPTREAVAAKVDQLKQYGAVLIGNIEQAGGKWTALCEIDAASR
jgi:class 3 adenylate cyclase